MRLTGPARAILCEDPVSFEIQLKLKGRAESEDRVFISDILSHDANAGDRFSTLNVSNHFCKMELCVERFKGSVQATILDVHVVEQGSPPFPHGGRVVCSSLPRRRAKLPNPEHRTGPSFWQVVLQDGAMTSCSQGYLDLSRHVVFVKLCGMLEVLIEANSRSGAMAAQVSIQARDCNITQNECQLGDSKLEITVAWSCLVRDKLWITRGANEEL